MTIAWNRIQTPLITLPGYSLKDPALMYHDGWFHLVCSVFDQQNHSRLMGWRSRDLADWDGPRWEWGQGSAGWCSPDILRQGDQWIMTFQSWDGIPPRESRNQLFYALSADGSEWSEPRPLAANLTEGVRAIDAAVAHHEGCWYLLYKEAQTPRIATADALEGPWRQLPNPLECWAENGQFLHIDGQWHLVATVLHHKQGIAAMTGDPDTPASWCRWEDFRLLDTPIIPGFNESTPANASALWDGRALDGHWYRVFCAAAKAVDGNWGWQLGVVRSKGLGNWIAPSG